MAPNDVKFQCSRIYSSSTYKGSNRVFLYVFMQYRHKKTIIKIRRYKNFIRSFFHSLVLKVWWYFVLIFVPIPLANSITDSLPCSTVGMMSPVLSTIAEKHEHSLKSNADVSLSKCQMFVFLIKGTFFFFFSWLHCLMVVMETQRPKKETLCCFAVISQQLKKEEIQKCLLFWI